MLFVTLYTNFKTMRGGAHRVANRTVNDPKQFVIRITGLCGSLRAIKM